MSILHLDFETTNLPDFEKRASDPRQPYIVQCAALITDDLGNVESEYNVLVRPDADRWEMSAEAFKAHGITPAKAQAEGVAATEMATKLLEMIRGTTLLVSFGATFEKFLARIALRRNGLFPDSMDAYWKQLPAYCVMRSMTPVCKLPPVAGSRGQFKYPKLAEAYFHAFGKQLEGAHDAMNDIRATKELYFWIKQNVK